MSDISATGVSSSVPESLALLSSGQHALDQQSVAYQQTEKTQLTLSQQFTTTSSSTAVSVNLSVEYRAQTVRAESADEAKSGAGFSLEPESISDAILGRVTEKLNALRKQSASDEELLSAIDAAKRGVVEGIEQASEVLSAQGILDDKTKQSLEKLAESLTQRLTAVAEQINAADKNPINSDSDTGSATKAVVADSAGDKQSGPIVLDDNFGEPEKAVAAAPNAGAPNVIAVDQSSSAARLSRFDIAESRVDYSAKRLVSNNNAYTERREKFMQAMSRYRASINQQQSFSLQLTTADGDTVELRFDRVLEANISARSKLFSGFAQERGRLSVGDASALQLSINGDLDEGELEAIESLISQLGDVTTAFFEQGDKAALSAALAIELDAEELSGFSFDLQSRTQIQASQKYRSVAALKSADQASTFNDNSLAALIDGLLSQSDKLLSNNREPDSSSPRSSFSSAVTDELLAGLLVAQQEASRADSKAPAALPV